MCKSSKLRRMSLMKKIIMPKIKLNNGNEISALGLGTFNFDEKTSSSLNIAFEIGYTLLDTSPAYKNEELIANKLWMSSGESNSLERKKYFLQTKLFLTNCYNHTEYKGLKESMQRLHTDYFDSYLMHWALPDKFIKNYKED